MPDKLKITLKTLPKQLSIAKNMEITIKSLISNPEKFETKMDAKSQEKFRKYAHSQGINKIAYVDVPGDLIFKDKSILFGKAILLVMEMDEDAINAAPSDQTQEEGISTYDELGIKTNALAQYLRDNGLAAHASHPAGGLVVYTQLAEKAGIGKIGRHGLLITPEFGPRQRISAIFVSAQNLTGINSSEHEWVKSFCTKCGRCIKKCPTDAITEEETVAGFIKTKIIDEYCQGCTICMKECSFNKNNYFALKNKFMT